MKLVIVESPTKAKTIQHFLPAGFSVRSSYGHVRDLPKGKLGVDTENNFEPKYVIPLLARKRLTEIKKILPKAEMVILASDEDREGEAIAWHLTHALNIDEKKTERIVFHEITKQAINEALKNPRAIDINLVNAQQARRILDRLVGYELSPFLWKKVAKGLSAGRVQSAAMRLIAEKEREIKAFKSEEYWSIEALLQKLISAEVIPSASEGTRSVASDRGIASSATPPRNDNTAKFLALLIKENGKSITKLGLKTEKEAKKIIDDLENAKWQVADVEQKEQNRFPAPPFVTSSLQQEAFNKLRFSAKQTMQIAQQLYEGVALGKEGSIGLITYMRTDSFNLAKEALENIKSFIVKNFGEKYSLPNPRFYKTKAKGAQEAHEAIRPSDISREPESLKEFLTPQQYRLYDLIWRRALACQMAPAIVLATTVDIDANPIAPLSKGEIKGGYTFRANGNQIKFDGFLKIYENKINENILPALKKDEPLDLLKLMPSQHFTQPPARFSEASLIKALEELGIGRPSTYAPIISTIQDRNYVQKDENKRLGPTEIGLTVNDLLVEHFPEIVDLKFTARMEENLDEIAEGKKEWVPIIREFYEPFKKHLTEKYEEVKHQKPEPELTDKICPKCGAPLLIRTSRFGKFYACSKFPECRYTENFSNPNASTGVICPKCIEGEIIAKRTKKGKIFYACSRYPNCDFALWDKPTGAKCATCGSLMVEGKKGTKCSNKECKLR